MTRPPDHGEVTQHGEGVRRIVAPNPGPMTHWGTNTWLLGEREVAVIDPGPDNAAHLDVLLSATRGQTVSHILVTHAHADHSPLARRLSDATGAPVYGFGRATEGRSALMERLARSPGIGGGEGLDEAFAPDIRLSEGARLEGDGWGLDVLHTPGHFAGHLSFAWGDTLFSGDHVMDWSTSLVSPPDGDVSDFMATSERLRDLGYAQCLTGHGNAVEAPAERLDALIRHRRTREAQILDALSSAPMSLDDLTRCIYVDVAPHLHPAASRNVLAHLIDLEMRNLIEATPEIGIGARFARP